MGASASLSVRSDRRAFCHACRRWLPIDEENPETTPTCPCGSDFVELMEDEQQVVQLTGDIIADILTAARGFGGGTRGADGERRGPGLGGFFALRMLAESTSQLTRALRASLTDSGGKQPADPKFVDDLPMIMIDKTLVSNELACSVCTSNFEYKEKAMKLPCNHIFHSDCIKPWFKTAHTCPMCRHEIPTSQETNKGSETGGVGAASSSSDLPSPAAAAPATRRTARTLRGPRHRYRTLGLRSAFPSPTAQASSASLDNATTTTSTHPTPTPGPSVPAPILDVLASPMPTPPSPARAGTSSAGSAPQVRAGGTVTHSHTPTSTGSRPSRYNDDTG
eukprot:TRINITY_DN6653_c0_g1_i1.p1 TRINITY_DN6653_c0_g1~~TRINITY_DN6653_c0_g1_i1.p1  ORF type:complete len:336 (+),score=31.97 TRINITY_DN6653_c0_g1_i1:562-1569(+)